VGTPCPRERLRSAEFEAAVMPALPAQFAIAGDMPAL
jgi:hypothetical protein